MLVRNKDHYKNPNGGLVDPLILNMLEKRVSSIVTNETLAIRSRLRQTAFDPRRDINEECGFPEDPVDSRLYQELYNRDGIAQRVVRVMPRECWQTQPSVFESEDESTITDFEAVWDSLGKTIKGEPSWYKDEEGSAIWEVLKRGDEWCGIGQYGIILLGLNDNKPLSAPVAGVVEENSQPVDYNVSWNDDKKKFVSNATTYPNGNPYSNPKPYRFVTNRTIITNRKLNYVRVIPEYLAYVSQYEQNINSPRYGRPVMYTIRLVDDYSNYSGIGIPIVSLNVHWTRVIHLVDEISPGEIFGAPRLRAVLNYILSLQKLYGGAGESYWRAAGPMLSFETHPQLGGDVEIDHDEFKDMIEQAMNSLQKYWTLMGMTVNTVAPPVNSPSEQIAAYLEAICINKEVPVRIFKGSERGELASTQDDDAWNDRLILRNYSHTSPRVIAPFVDRLITVGVLPVPDYNKTVKKKSKSVIGRIIANQGYGIFWPDLTSRSALEKAQIAEIKINAAAAYAEGSLKELIAPIDIFTKWFEMDAEEAATMLERAKEEQQKNPEEKDKLETEEDTTTEEGSEEALEGLEIEPDEGDQETTSAPTNQMDYSDNGEDEFGTWNLVGNVTDLITNERVIVHAGRIVINKNGKKKKLNKPFRTPSGPKKFAVYVRKDNGNVILVRFGDSDMEIKRDDPKRRKAFRDRHNCDNPGPKWKPRYWSCKMWSAKSVTDILNEDIS